MTVADGTEHRARFLVAATGVLSVPYVPDVPGRDDFRGEVEIDYIAFLLYVKAYF